MPSVNLERDGAVGWVTVSNPTIKNALNNDMGRQFATVCAKIEQDERIGCVVIRGEGGTFCSGADTDSWAEAYSDGVMTDEAYEASDSMYGTFVRFGQLPVPTIAAVRGAAVGAGFNLALAADTRVVARDARLIAGFTAAGIHPGGGFFTLARRLAGREMAGALGLFGQEISGERAYEVGFAATCVEDDRVEQTAAEMAMNVAGDPLLARRVKRSFQIETAGPFLTWDGALEVERGVQMWSQERRLSRAAQ
ncbi:enoyl-CoA hydratase [Marihabitans asiaticum]|uniref:Enoyl-CoA hydratase n=1 Tax=Marihabitans asiaticum TaxID=415218 RepID=A0A560WGB2_9MICO|nr:enoyl-CoA hydratase/isomerase family protein [Marihabitans asiaticum]TWD16722.1 enoyl-CoA hydratase [Marihabitans asiaticum]